MKVGDLVGYNWEQWASPPSSHLGIVLEVDEKYGYATVWWYQLAYKQQIATSELLIVLMPRRDRL